MTTRLIIGACMLAQVAHAQSVAKPALATRTTQRETETGSWRSGDAIVWVRVAPTGAISVYASHGYRSAFAHAVVISPEDAEKWADIGDHVLTGQTTSGTFMLADSDLAIQPGRAGDSAVLAVRLGGVRPDGITFLMNGQTLRDVTPMLRATAKTARSTQAVSAAPPPPPPAPTPAPAAAPTPATPAATPAAPNMAVVDSPPPAPVAPSAPAPVVAIAAIAPPEVAAPDTPAPAPEAEVAPIAPSAPVTPVIKAAPAIVATPAKIAKVTKTKPAPQSAETASLRRTSAGSIAKSATPAKPDAIVANLVQQWQSQLNLCYTEYGLKVNPALTGSIAVRLAIRPSGDVGAATFTRHNWSGTGGTEAESCMRARVMAWMFPPASTGSAHEFTVAFAP